MRVLPACVLLLSSLACARAWAWPRPRGMAYLPPAPADQAPAADPPSDPAPPPPPPAPASNDSQDLLNRFGDDGIYFAQGETDDLRPQAIIEQQVRRDVSRGITHLALSLDRVLSVAPEGGRALPSASARDNVLFSPLSIAAALALVLLGSGGRTYDEVSQVLGLTMGGAGALTAERDNAIHQHFGRLLGQLHRRAAATDSSEALSAHGVFVQQGLPLRARFRKVAQQAYHSDVQELDFVRRPLEAQAAVNAWVKERTRGRIADMLSQPPPAATRLVLATALYFNGQWQHPFPRETTQRRPFYVDGDASGEVLQVEMMANSADLPYAEDPQLRCKILGLPYKGGDVSMYIVLPHDRGLKALKALEASLTVEALDRLINATKLETDVIVVLPRTKLDFSVDLRSALERLGVTTLFDAGAANLTRLVGGGDEDESVATASAPPRAAAVRATRQGTNRLHQGGATSRRAGVDRDAMHFRSRRDVQEPLYVDTVLHKVEVEITEMGTVASAATLATVSRDGSHRSVRADRPFLFCIRHQPSGLLLFWGSVVRPRPTPPIV